MALHDGLVNWPLFFGCILLGFGPLASLFFIVVAKRAQLVIISLSGAFIWLVAILVTASLWHLIPPLKTSLAATIPLGVIVQEAFRLLFFYLYTHTELAVKRLTTSCHQLPLNDITSSLAGGVGFALMHSLLMFGSLLGSSTGSRGAAFSTSCDSIPLIFSAAISTLALTIIDVGLMIIAFDGYRKRSVLLIGTVFGIHMGVALSALANLDTNGCFISIPVHYAGAVLVCLGATTIGYRSKRLTVDAK
ncbi:unnamed protein product [Peronospora farinosa]|uniref:Gamma-secretase subunit Aph-1 n=1 Tax=Peronospora farinosa TaxID=134698 RepID=A0AAV0T534_9STRA|nr:unnamed protein product [Peronospora farinosa]CAI5712191.1 unnamed protein product [Peronospora farinosa]